MYNLNYIPTEKRREKESLEKRGSDLSLTKEQRQEITEKIKAIEAMTKPLNQCTVDECIDFKRYIMSKISALNSVRKYSIAKQLENYIRQIEFRMQTATIEDARREQRRQMIKEVVKDVRRKAHEDRRDSVSSEQVQNPWAIDVDE